MNIKLIGLWDYVKENIHIEKPMVYENHKIDLNKDKFESIENCSFIEPDSKLPRKFWEWNQ